jgi:hypothetical protein
VAFYHHRNAVSAQCQGAGIWLQVGRHILGYCPLDYRDRYRPLIFGLALWAPIRGNGMRIAFSLEIGRAKLSYWTRGETKGRPGHYLSDMAGWNFRIIKRRTPRPTRTA